MEYLKVEVFVPDENKRDIIDGLNEKEILKDEGYDSVFSETPVVGHFIPLPGSHPDIGDICEKTTVSEVKLEFRIKKEEKDEVFMIIKDKHPYEVPVINFIELL